MFGIDMSWRHLLFANWPVDPAVVDERIPSSMDVDTYDGDAWLSVVPFVNAAIRPSGVPAALGIDLPELNLRTYMTADGEPGVYFFSLDAEGWLSVLGARLFHHLPYYYARIDCDPVGDSVFYRSRRRHPGARHADFLGTYGPDGEPFRPEKGSLAEFLVERYRYYAEGRTGELRYADVSHDRWTLAPADVDVRENTVFGANGFAHPERDPVHYVGREIAVSATDSKRWE